MPIIAVPSILAGLFSGISSLFVAVAGFLAAFIGKRLAITVAAIAAISAITVVFFSAIVGLYQTIIFTAPPELGIVASWIVPSNGLACVSAILSAKTFRWIYVYKMGIIQMKLL